MGGYNGFQETGGNTRLGLVVMLGAVLCIFVQMNISELHMNTFELQVRPIKGLVQRIPLILLISHLYP